MSNEAVIQDQKTVSLTIDQSMGDSLAHFSNLGEMPLRGYGNRFTVAQKDSSNYEIEFKFMVPAADYYFRNIVQVNLESRIVTGQQQKVAKGLTPGDAFTIKELPSLNSLKLPERPGDPRNLTPDPEGKDTLRSIVIDSLLRAMTAPPLDQPAPILSSTELSKSDLKELLTQVTDLFELLGG